MSHNLLFTQAAREDFCRNIRNAIKRQLEIGRMVQIYAFNEVKYCLFVAMPNIKVMSQAERQDYVFSAILCDESRSIMWIDLDYDEDSKLIGAKGKQCSYTDIPPDG
jgi:hypothetical protein